MKIGILGLALLALPTAATAQARDLYPPAALREHREGTTELDVTVSTRGRTSDCRITRSSGSADLDRASCQTMARAQWKPAVAPDGSPIESHVTKKVTWRLPR